MLETVEMVETFEMFETIEMVETVEMLEKQPNYSALSQLISESVLDIFFL